MKKLIALLVLVGMVAPVFSATDSHNFNASLSVAPGFGLFDALTPQIPFAPADIVFSPSGLGGMFDPSTGGEDYKEISFVVKSNLGTTWKIKTWATADLQLADLSASIPAAKFTYKHGNSTLLGTYVPAGAGVFAQVPVGVIGDAATTVYTCAASEKTTQYTGMGLGFKVVVPAAQKQGTYSTTLNIALSDDY